MSDDVVLVDDDVGCSAADVDYGNALLLFVGSKYGFSRGDSVQIEAQRSDIHPFEGHLKAVDGDRVSQDDVERRG